jgi:hypothetical protein
VGGVSLAFVRNGRWRAALKLCVTGSAVAALVAVPATHAAASTADINVNFGSTVAVDSSAAIGLDESTYGSPDDFSDATARKLLTNLGVGYAEIQLTINSSGTVICGAAACNTSQSAGTWITDMKNMGETPVVSIPDTITSANAAAIVRYFNVTTDNPVTYWEIGDDPDGSESATTYSAQFNALDAAMTAVSSLALQIGGPATGFYNPGFLQTFLDDSRSRIDFVEFQAYGTGDSTSESTLLSGLPTLSTDLTDLRTMINNTLGTQVPIHVGEWNLSYENDSLDCTEFASAYDADLLGRILAAGDVSQAFGTKDGGLGALYDTSGGGCSFSEDTPMPLYEAISMFTGADLFAGLGTTMVSATSSLSGVVAFASSAPDDIVLVNTNSSADASTVAIASGGSLSAAEWQISQPASPVHIGTLSTTDGTFSLTLPAQSVTTLVVT